MIECRFSCKACRASDAPFLVRVRGTNEDVVRWVEDAVRPAMALAHSNVSPGCPARIADLKIPMGADRVGEAKP